MYNSANCRACQSWNKMNSTSQPLEHVSGIKKSVNGENESHAHNKDRDDGKWSWGSAVVQQLFINRGICCDFIFIGKKIVVSAFCWKGESL